MVLEMMMESVFAITDIFFVSALGPEAISVVGLTEAVITLLYAVAIGLGMAVTATVARRVGGKNIAGANQVATQTIWLGLGVALAVGIPGSIYAIDILYLMGASHSDHYWAQYWCVVSVISPVFRQRKNSDFCA
jgi:Na+-driven multidrug efflux pump